MSYTENDPTVIGGPTKKSDFAAAFDNSQFNRDSVGDFSQVIIGTGVTGAAFTWQDDLDTYISNPASDEMAFVTGGSERIRIISSGNVGIGTTPTSFFHLKRTLTGDQATDRVMQQIHVATSDGNMSDGFGPTLLFVIEDVAAVANSIGEIQCLRDGADDSGKIKLRTYNAGSPVTAVEIDSSQNTMFTGGIDPGNNGTPWKTKIIDIGDWDMDADALKNVAHGLTLANIRTVRVFIRNDDNDTYYDFSAMADLASPQFILANATVIGMQRAAGGDFDDVEFDSTSYNRGWITITYV